MRFFQYILLISTFALSPTVLSQETNDTLDPQLIEMWISSQASFEIWGKQNEEILTADVSPSSNQSNPMEITIESMVQPLKDAGLLASANKVAKKNGFINIDHWAKVTLRVTKAAASLELESQPEVNDLSELTALLETPDISEKQKAMIEYAIKQNKAMVKQLTEDVSKEDKQAVKPYLSKIQNMMDQPY